MAKRMLEWGASIRCNVKENTRNYGGKKSILLEAAGSKKQNKSPVFSCQNNIRRYLEIAALTRRPLRSSDHRLSVDR